jgi:hypothetical protein
MIKVNLRFPTGNDLYEFRQRAIAKNVTMDFATNSMIGLCTEEDIELAVKQYGASVINMDDVNKSAEVNL